jgi:predicted dehydrogenase
MVDAARAGKHVAVQKPMTNDLASADRMLEAAEGAGIVFKVTDNYLFYPPIVLAKEMIDNGDIGTPTNLRMKLISSGSGGWEVPDSAWEWRVHEAVQGRGFQTFDHGHHLWATAWFLLGDIERVVSWIDSADGVVDSPAVIMWKYEGAAKYGMCEYCYSSDLHIPSKYYANDEWIEITGSRGMIVIHRCTGQILDGPAVSVFDSKGWRRYEDIDSDWGAGFIGATGNFIGAIRGKEDPLLSGPQGKEILKISLAIQESSTLRKELIITSSYE